MGFLMDLVAGDSREILLTIAIGDWAGLEDPDRSMGTWHSAGRWARPGSTCTATRSVM